MPAMSTEVRYSKSKKVENSANITMEVLRRQNVTISQWEEKYLQS